MKRSILCLALCSSVIANATVTNSNNFLPHSKSTKSQYHFKKMQETYKTNAKGDILETLDFGAEPSNWFNLSPFTDRVEGVSTEEAYRKFGLPQNEIIVAVIDSGVDVNHEDLQGRIWINTDEIADNGIDDDNNGYIDDVFGWNFIGGKKGMAKIIKDSTSANGYKLIKGNPKYQINADSLEITREVLRLRKLERELNEIGYYLSAEEKQQLTKYENEVTREYALAKPRLDEIIELKNYFSGKADILKAAGVSVINFDTVSNFRPANQTQAEAKTELLKIINSGYDEVTILEEYDYLEGKVTYYNLNANHRVSIVGDDQTDPRESNYGNNDVIGPESSHGTHVAGIIAANRMNQIGMKGVASNAKIMAIRCVPNGDERDKDVANSIRYAVDNGAKIINMSFGKKYSPNKTVVDEAIKYAQDHNVMLVHAAGNEFLNTDIEKKYPNKFMANDEEASNWIEVGASAYKADSSLAASFSNYGKTVVDLFAPGKNIYATFPNNTYKAISGTSMATPVVSGVLAMTLGYKDLTVEVLRDIALNTTKRYPGLVVFKRGLGQILFSNLSATGGVINVLNMLEELKIDKQTLIFNTELAGI